MMFKTFVSTMALASFAAQANAGFVFTPTSPLYTQYWSDSSNHENDIANDYGVDLVYKLDAADGGLSAGGTEGGGDFDPFYAVTAPDGTNTASSGRIDWSGDGSVGSFIDSAMTYLYLKDGNDGSYLFELKDGMTGDWWDGKQKISWSGFWKNQGKFSHVSIFAKESAAVPEPASYALWGAAVCIGCLVRRRQRSSSKMKA